MSAYEFALHYYLLYLCVCVVWCGGVCVVVVCGVVCVCVI